MKKYITLKEVLSWKPCITEQQILEITKGKKRLSLFEVCNLKISHGDRIWVLLRSEILGKKIYREIVFKIADQTVKKYCLKCGIRGVEKWAKNWLSEKNKSRAAAYTAAAYTAVANAAYAAANAAYAERKWQLNLIKKYIKE